MAATQESEVALERRSLFQVADPSGLEIACTRGSVWITLDHDTRDIVLAQGETFFTTEHRRALVYAFDAAVIELREPARAVQPSSRRMLAKNSSDCSRSPSVWDATRPAISG